MHEKEDIDETVPFIGDQRSVKNLDRVLDEIPFSYFHIRLILMCGLVFMADAMQVGMLAVISDCAGVEWGLSASEKAALVSVVFAGELVGSLFWAKIADYVGRRTTVLIIAGVIFAGGLCSAIAPSYFCLLFLQAVVGFGIGGLIVPFDLVAEFLPTENRGRYLLYVNYFWTFGSLIANGSAWGILRNDTWRVLTMVTCIPVCFASILCIIFLPESPRWLLLQGRKDDAVKELVEAASVNGITLAPFQLESIVPDNTVGLEIETEKDGGNYKDLVINPELRVIALPITLVWMIFGFTYYGLILFVAAIYSTNDDDGTCDFDYQDMFINSSSEVVGLSIAVYLIDSLGRIKTQSLFYFVAGITVVGLGPVSGNIPVLLIGFIARGAISGALNATWVPTPELYNTRNRATGHAVCNAAARMGALGAPFLIDSSMSDFSIALALGICNTVAALLTLFFLPETAGAALDPAPQPSWSRVRRDKAKKVDYNTYTD